MGLNVPITVRVGDVHMTERIEALAFRKEAVGGLKNITFRLANPINRLDPDLVPLRTVTLFDAGTAEVIAEGRVSDPGRSATVDGQMWDAACFGPAQHASDRWFPYIVVDQASRDGWRQVDRVTKGGNWTQSTKPGSTSDTAAEAQVFQFPQGLTVGTSDEISSRYERIREAGMKLGGFGVDTDGGSTDTDYQTRVWPRTDGAGGSASVAATLSTSAASTNSVVVTDFSNGCNTVDLKFRRLAGSGAVANDNKWAAFSNFVIRSLLLNADGTERTTGYANQYVLAHEVVNDLLGRILVKYDAAVSSVDTSAAFHIDSLIYPDGVTAEQVFEDLMRFEPAYRWAAFPGGRFVWEPWPTAIRYVATLEDSGYFPVSTQELFNNVEVWFVDNRGRTRSQLRTMACQLLDDEGEVRTAQLDMGDSIQTTTAANRVGDNFLAAHNVPANAGTLSVSRPILDLKTGRMVRPQLIEPGELVLVRGLEGYVDSLNASSSDGQTVFRIWAMNYGSDTDTAVLELDTYPRDTAKAIRKLMTRRIRKR